MQGKNRNENDFQNDWAFNDDFTRHIHISEAKSGLNGYYCLGCKKEMLAAKGTKRVHYYRHHAKNVDNDNTECVVASRKYRERIARDILQRLKELKVPEVFKLPPIGQEGMSMLLKPSETIKAHKVKSELTFYEDEDCRISWGQNPDIDERYLLIRPDITFFNHNDEPILLIEFVVSHKIDDEKRIKLKRLGFNTVQIIIPKRPEDEIERALKSINKVKWVYNEIEANTNYIFVSETADNGVWSIDDDQRNIFEESYKCRASQLKYLIRTVKRALESQSYKRTEHLFRSEISRIEKATASEQQRLGELEARMDSEVRDQFTEQLVDVEKQKRKLDDSESEFQGYSKGLDERYQLKREEIEVEQQGINDDKRAELENGGTEESIRQRFNGASKKSGEDFERAAGNFEQNIQRGIKSQEELSQETGELTGSFARLEREEQERSGISRTRAEEWVKMLYRSEEENLSENIRTEESHIKELRAKEEAFSNEFGQLEEQARESFRGQKAILDSEEKRFEESIRKEPIRELKEPTSKLPRRLKFILEAQRVGRDYEDAQRKEQYYQSAREFFNKGTWQEE